MKQYLTEDRQPGILKLQWKPCCNRSLPGILCKQGRIAVVCYKDAGNKIIAETAQISLPQIRDSGYQTLYPLNLKLFIYLPQASVQFW